MLGTRLPQPRGGGPGGTGPGQSPIVRHQPPRTTSYGTYGLLRTSVQPNV